MTPHERALLLATARTLRALLTHRLEGGTLTEAEAADYLFDLDGALAPFQGEHGPGAGGRALLGGLPRKA